MARQGGLSRALAIFLGAEDFEADKAEADWLYQSMGNTLAQERFQYADDNGAQFNNENQRNWNNLVIAIQGVK